MTTAADEMFTGRNRPARRDDDLDVDGYCNDRRTTDSGNTFVCNVPDHRKLTPIHTAVGLGGIVVATWTDDGPIKVRP